MEPWLDSLSEDWPSEPGSLSQISIHLDSPDFARPKPNSPAQYRSRIPRYNGNTRNSSPPLLRSSPKSFAGGTSVLAQRRDSRENSRLGSPSSASRLKKSDQSVVRACSSSTTSSDASVVRHDLTSNDARTVLPTDRRVTPEWKKLAFRNQNNPASQPDLFAPIGLESIFEQPESSEQDGPEDQTNLSYTQDISVMPSSPPPWSHDRKRAKIAHEPHQKTAPEKSKLSIVQEYEESATSTPNMRSDDQKLADATDERPVPGPSSTLSICDQSAGPKFHVICHNDGSSQTLQSGITIAAPTSSACGGSSVVSGGFSPVYIAKHNTDSGQVSYVAVDPSDPGVQQQIRLLQSQSSRQTSQPETLQRPRTPDNNFNSSALQRLPNLSGYVSVKRGGFSDQGSFKHRPLSPSLTESNLPSESVVPSDSVSQVHRNNHPPVHNPDAGGPAVQPPQTPKAQTSPAAKSPSRTKSTGSPLKLFGNHDTFTNNQLLRRMSQMKNVPSSSPSSTTAQEAARQSLNSQVDGGVSSETEADSAQTAMHIANTAPTSETETFSSQLMSSAPATDKRPTKSIIGKKRKDALYGNDLQYCDPAEIARRLMLRPRNPSPTQTRLGGIRASIPQMDGEGPSSSLDLLGENESSFLSDKSMSHSEAAKIRALATEAASFRGHGPDSLRVAEPRKPSVSTQDYLNEAMKIMDLIRSRKQSVTAMTGVEEGSVVERVEQDLAGVRPLTPQTISRPPSREGQAAAWRDGAGTMTVDPKVLDHLKKYQETGDESFIVSSILRSMKASRDAVHDDDNDFRPQAQSDNIRIRERQVPDQALHLPQESRMPGEFQSPLKSTGSSQSTNSTGRTLNTTASQHARNLSTIDPNKVSHLIQAETGGMKFDAEKKTWFRVKQLRQSEGNAKQIPSSSAGSDDPFGDISDLTVDEQLESLRINSTSSRPASLGMLPISEDVVESSKNFIEPVSTGSIHTHETNAAETSKDDETQAERVLESVDAPRASELRITRERPGTATRSKPMGPSVLFSSPPVSKHWEPRDLEQSSDVNSDDTVEIASAAQPTSRQNSTTYQFPIQTFMPRWRQELMAEHDFDSELSLVTRDEFRELSFFEQRSANRSMSLTLSITTPLPAGRRSISRATAPASGAVTGRGFLHSLSPMSDFTIHQSDTKHQKSHQLQAGNTAAVGNGFIHSSQAVSRLVEKLTDAEPDEPYWDFMRCLDLSKKTLDNVHGLDEFCPSIEEANLSGNTLTQLIGAPASIRTLNASDNLLTSLTSWAHLSNLQYLDISCNNLESLEGLSGLVHLRGLTADNNQIRSVKGLEDLDGLLSLSLKNNSLTEVDFAGTELKRLAVLDMSFNALCDLRGLSAMPALRELRLVNNRLSSFETEPLQRLEILDVSGNEVTNLDLERLPRLQRLWADSNRLVKLGGARLHSSLRILSLRNQRFDDSKQIFEQPLDDFQDIEYLTLSGTPLPRTLFFVRPLHSLRTLDISFTGIQALDVDMSILAPNLRTLNLNANAIKDLRAVRGLSRLQSLSAAGNRLGRVRRLMKAISGMQELRELDVRDNAVCTGFYRPALACAASQGAVIEEPITLGHVLPQSDPAVDVDHLARLDTETGLKRRVFELLLGAKCPRLGSVNGLPFEKSRVMEKDAIWNQLVEMGVVEKA